MALHWNPFYKSTFAEKKDSFPLRMQRALQTFSGAPTANNNLHGKTHEDRKNEAVLGIFDYLTFGLPAGIDKLWLMLKRFIIDKREEHTGFWFGCLKGLAVIAAIPTFLASTLFNIARFLFGIAGMLITFPVAVVATLAEFEGAETKKYNQPQNMDSRLNDPYINPKESSNMQQLFENKDGAMNQTTPTQNIILSNPNTENHAWKNPFEPDNDDPFNSVSLSSKSN